MSANIKPVTLPENFYSTWAVPEPASGKSATVSDVDPFSDSAAYSRVTASGFTNSTIMPVKHKETEDIEWLIEAEIRDQEAKRDRKEREESSLWKKKGKFTEAKTADGKDREIDNRLLNQAKMSLERYRASKEDMEVTSQRTRVDDSENGDREKYVTMKDFTDFTKTISSIHPRDSASQVGTITSRKDEPKGLFQLKNTTSSKLSGILEMESDIEGTVIGGYDMSVEEKIREIEAFNKIPSVRGLPRVYVNERLNFLSHIHTALFRFVTDDNGKYPSPQCLDVLIDSRKTWGNDPETSLLIVVLDRTIDYRSSVVIANPFRLPILEPTMELTSLKMYMCLDQLHKEFETEYFNTVKTMTVPDFHNKYGSRKYRSSTNEKRRSSGAMTQSSSSSSRSSRGDSRRGSMVEEGSFLSRVSRR